jgi:HK97 family phage major capsid protein
VSSLALSCAPFKKEPEMSNRNLAAEIAEHQQLLDNVQGDIADLIDRDNPTEEQVERLERQVDKAQRIRDELVLLRAERDAAKARIAEAAAKGHIAAGVGHDDWHASTRTAAWDAPIDPRDKRGLESRALAALDQQSDLKSDDGDRIDRLVRSDAGGADAELVIVTSNPHYRTAFRKMVRDPQFGHLAFTPDEQAAFAAAQGSQVRTAMSTTAGNGGYLIPFALDPTIQLTNTGTQNPWRDICRVTTLNNSNIWHGVSSAGVSAEWTGEAAEATDASPTFSQPTITAQRADVYVQGSYEVFEDSNIDEQLTTLFMDAKDRHEATAFATGSGTNRPYGVVTRLQGTTASRVAAQTNASFGAVDVYAMDNNLPARYQPNAAWVAPKWMFNLCRQFPGTNQSTFWVDMGGGTPAELIGHPTYLSSDILNAGGTTGLSTATASNDDVLVIADFKQLYTIVDRIGSLMISNPWIVGSNNRPTGQTGWYFFWRVGGDTTNNDAGRLLRI